MSNPNQAFSYAVLFSIAVSSIGGLFLFRYFSERNLFGLKTMLKERNEELELYDKRIQYLEMKIQENYQIANS